AICIPCTRHPRGHRRWTSAPISHSQSAIAVDSAGVVRPAHRVRTYIFKTYGIIGATARCGHTLPLIVKADALMRVQTFSDFNPDNDPHGEHDFGSFEVAGQKFFWKIDYYDRCLRFGSKDPADPSKTNHVLTIRLADECRALIWALGRPFFWKNRPALEANYSMRKAASIKSSGQRLALPSCLSCFDAYHNPCQ